MNVKQLHISNPESDILSLVLDELRRSNTTVATLANTVLMLQNEVLGLRGELLSIKADTSFTKSLYTDKKNQPETPRKRVKKSKEDEILEFEKYLLQRKPI